MFDGRPAERDRGVDASAHRPAHLGRGGARRPVRAGPARRGPRPGVRGRARLHRRPRPAARPPGGADPLRPRGRGHVLLPGPRRLRRALHGRGPRGAGPGGGGGLGALLRPRARDHGRLLHGRLGGAAARGPVPARARRRHRADRRPAGGRGGEHLDGRGRLGERTGPVVLPGDRPHAPAALAGPAPRGPPAQPLRPAHPHPPPRLGSRAAVPGRGGAAHRAHPAADRARRPGRLLPLDHPRMLAEAAGDHAELWLEPGMGHAENAAGDELLHRIARWASAAAG